MVESKKLTKGQIQEIRIIRLQQKVELLELKNAKLLNENVELKLAAETKRKKSRGRKAAKIDMVKDFGDKLIKE